MSKEGCEPTPSAPLPTAPPPPYEAICPQPPYNPHVQASVSPPYHYNAPPVVNETAVQASQPPYPQQMYHPQAVQITTVRDNLVGVPLLVGPKSLRTTCLNCRSPIQTRTSIAVKGIAHLFCLGLFFIGCCLCSCIPYCLDSLKEVRHTCPKCKAHLGTYRN